MAAALGETFGAGTAGGWSPAAWKSDFTKRKAMTCKDSNTQDWLQEGPGFVWCIV